MARSTIVHWHVFSSIREAASVEDIKMDVKVYADMEHPSISNDGVAEKNRGRHEVRQPAGVSRSAAEAPTAILWNIEIVGWD